jgi:hypothetical protein
MTNIEQYQQDCTMDLYDALINDGICTEEEATLVTCINGNSTETYLDILFARTGCRSLEQYQQD